MKPTNNKILVRCDVNQKDFAIINGIEFQMAAQYETNFREKSPVVCEVVEGNELVYRGDALLTHHNLFYLPSPYHVEGDLFSIPFSNVLFAKILKDGSLYPICGNILTDRIEVKTEFLLPDDLKEKYINKSLVVDPGLTNYKKGQVIFHKPYAFYEIIYTWNGEQRRIHKVHEDQVVGYKVV